MGGLAGLPPCGYHRVVRILVGNQQPAELDALAAAAEGLGHDVVARHLQVDEVAHAAEDESVDLAFIGLPAGENEDHALGMIGELVRGGLCPVVIITVNEDPGFVARAAELGVYAHTTRLEPVLLRGAIDVALRRFNDHANLVALVERRTLIERAKGILMERYDLDENTAFLMLRSHARNSNLRLTDAAQRILAGHRLLPGTRRSSPPAPRQTDH